jgi:hypothetical protein
MSIPNVLVSSFITIEVGGFGRSAQAASLLDEVLKCFDARDLRARLIHLNSLDFTLQSFLNVVMEQRQGKWGIYCGAIAIAIR